MSNELVVRRVESGGVERAEGLALPGVGVEVRDARLEDVAFLDELQRVHSKAVGWMPLGQLEGHVKKRHVVIAETPPPAGERVGYCIGVDRYFKRDDVGIIYQMNIRPDWQRGLIGATLLQAMFDRWPWGVRLCSCWCAQDLPANRFWEAVGFVPLAFRTGSRKRDRIHIFWQKAIRAEDRGGQGASFRGWWYPSQTGSGALREDRVVLPIPPDVHWADAKPRVLPPESGVAELLEEAADRRAESLKLTDAERAERRAQRKLDRQAKAKAREAAEQRAATVASGGLRFGPPGAGGCGNPVPSEVKKTKAKKREPLKNDPRLVAAARELCGWWLELTTTQPGLLQPQPRYRVERVLPESPTTAETQRLFDQPDRLAA
jgi:N-acetylglutamate synthase-like GNAT family acetyltransferase